MKKKSFFLICFFFQFFIENFLFAQSDSLTALINDLSENETYLTELLQDLHENPININYADKEDLLLIPLITQQMADSIINTRNIIGQYKSKRQISRIVGSDIYSFIKNYISASQKRKYNVQLIHRNSYKIEPIPEIETGKYEDSPVTLYTRAKYQLNAYTSVGFVTQKDAGEKMKEIKQKVVD